MNQYELLKKHETLWSAWHHVSLSSLTSGSNSIRQAAKSFNKNSQKNILSISSLLSHGSFIFDKAEGYLKTKKNKASVRPVVLATVRDRVVQRAVLEVLYKTPELEKLIKSKNSFGGINELGVKDAISEALKAIDGGAKYFITSDISNFFTKIPKSLVLKIVQPHVDQKFVTFLNQAMGVELANIAGLKENLKLFPLTDIGVAQGCCLSPVVGNILLSGFDESMNQNGITCIRYIDDFILLGESQKSVREAFKKAKGILSSFGLTAYDPLQNPDKAREGLVSDPFNYLGCTIYRKIVAPSKESQTKLLLNIKRDMDTSITKLKTGDFTKFKKNTFLETLAKIDLRIESWGNQYSHCNEKNFRSYLDRKINDLVNNYRLDFSKLYKNEFNDPSKRRMIGVKNLIDCRIVEPEILNTTSRTEKYDK